jgi:5-methylcytosine-specific restriction endonuclease McrA
MKNCTVCSISFVPRGREAKCNQCVKNRRRELFNQNPEKYRKMKRNSLNNWRNNNREYVRDQAALARKLKPELHRKHSKNYSLRNTEKIRIKNKKYKSQNPHLAAEHTMKRLIKKKQGSLDNYDKKSVEIIYKTCTKISKETGVKHNVDHIIPLTHELVCGLHVPWNLQILTKSENVIKKNKWDGTYDNTSWK